MSPDSEGLGAAVVAGVGSNIIQPNGITHYVLYIYSTVPNWDIKVPELHASLYISISEIIL